MDTRHSWNWFRRFKWKGRLHISIHLKKSFLTVLRYDLMFDVIWMSLLVYLQVLAFIMAKKITEEDEAKKKLNNNGNPGSSPQQSGDRILMQPHLNLNVSSFTQLKPYRQVQTNICCCLTDFMPCVLRFL